MTFHPSASKRKSKREPVKARNTRLVQKYVYSLRHQQGLSDATINHHLAAIRRYLFHSNGICFSAFNSDVALKFKEALSKEANAATGEQLSQATIGPILRKVRSFFEWLIREPGYRRRPLANDILYLKPKLADVRRLRGARRKFASLRQWIKAFDAMPTNSLVHRRNKAYFAILLLTSGRTQAIITLPLSALCFRTKAVRFDANVSRTKLQTTFTAYFNPVPKRVAKFLSKWVKTLEKRFNFGPCDPILPKFSHPWQNKECETVVALKEFYKHGTPLVASFKSAFEAIGVTGIVPHSLRTTMYHEIDKLGLTSLETKAYSMNLGQKDQLTLVNSYSKLSEGECKRSMKRIRKRAKERR